MKLGGDGHLRALGLSQVVQVASRWGQQHQKEQRESHDTGGE